MGINIDLAKEAQKIAEKLSIKFYGTSAMSELLLGEAYRIIKAKEAPNED